MLKFPYIMVIYADMGCRRTMNRNYRKNVTRYSVLAPVVLTVLVISVAWFTWFTLIEEKAQLILPAHWQRWAAPVFFGFVALSAVLSALLRYQKLGNRASRQHSDEQSEYEIGLTAFQNLPGNHFWLWNWQTESFRFCNDWLRTYGYANEDTLRSQIIPDCDSTPYQGSRPLACWQQLIHPEDADAAIRQLLAYQSAASGEQLLEHQYRIKAPDGTFHWISSAVRSVRSPTGGILGLAAVFTDITCQMAATEQLAQEKSFSEGLISSTDLFVLVLDTAGRILRFNPFAQRITGYTEAEVNGRSWIDCLFREADKPDMRRLFERVKINQVVRQKRANILHKDGHELEIIWHYHPLTNHLGKTVQLAVIGFDITDRRILEKQLYELAFFDRLTGLANQMRLEQSLQSMISKRTNREESLTVIYFDIDHFKHVNDALGYSSGDELLQWVAARLRSLVKEPDIVARLGEDEFVMLLNTHRTERSVRALIHELQRILHEPWQKDSHTFQITISTGVAFFPQHGSDFKTLLQHASIALFNAKDHGRNQICFYDQQMYLRNLRYIDQVNQLNLAIKEKQFVLHYQLQYDLKSGQPRGAEALIRWQHPQRGLIPPQSFIPLAEAAGCINEISKWVLEEASCQKRLWNQQGLDVEKIAVNLSGYCFKLEDLTSIVNHALSASNLTGDAIELEITESALLDNIDGALDKIKQLQEQGLTFVLDDFGTGYSSLTYLRILPVQVIKIDKTFIRTMLENPADARIVRAIIDLAHDLDLTVVAEGIETLEQMKLLQAYNCDYGQGFLFHRPQAANQIILHELGHPAISQSLSII